MNYSQMRSDRLEVLEDWLRDEILISWKDVPRALYEADLVTKNYGEQNLIMDIWFLRRSYQNSVIRSTENFVFAHSKIRFQIVLRSLLDLQIGRPCDFGIWKCDTPSDSDRCRTDYHICYQDAETYLLSIDAEAECECGLSVGIISDLVHKIKKDPIFSIGSILSCGVPTSFVALKMSNHLPITQTSISLIP